MSRKIIETPADILGCALRTKYSCVVRRVQPKEGAEFPLHREQLDQWVKKHPGVKVQYIASLPETTEIADFVTKKLPPQGMALVEGYGMLAWGARAENVSRMIRGESPETEQELPSRPFKQRVVLITGAGRGVGAGLAKAFFRDGANVVVTDIDSKAGEDITGSLNADAAGNEACFIPVDVTDDASVADMVDKVICHFGGIDVAVSNAGVLKAGGLEEMTPQDFDFVNAVNYRGFFLLTKYVSAVMKRQARFDPERFADIIQINSKSGLQGSNRNFAYAGSKFGSIGLVQSFAKELVTYRIKVNAVCPGNFFDLPLWSDPENGLFVQYLRTGKVPGARTVEEVRKHYETLVPMKRGCRVEDLYKAVKYIIEQHYETGQALPVTGGQVMLD